MDISRIGIGITTRNRPDILAYTIEQFYRFTPPQIDIVIVDDNSDEKFDTSEKYVYNTKRLGVAKSKNECIKALNHDYIFLFDDDCFPIIDKWWESWIDAECHHLVMSPGKGVRELTPKYRKMEGGLGCCLFMTREVVNTIGGFDPNFGLWGYEHAELSNRICMAGLTDWVYNAPLKEGVYSFDYSGSRPDFEWKSESSMTNDEKAKAVSENGFVFQKAIKRMKDGDYFRDIWSV